MARDSGEFLCQHAGMHVHSIKETVQWYKDIFGFEEVPTPDSSQFGGCFPPSQLIKKGNFYLELYEVTGAKPFSTLDLEWTVGVKHLSFYVENLDELMDYIYERKDVRVLVDNHYSEEISNVPGGDRAVYILDNEGILIELTKEKSRG